MIATSGCCSLWEICSNDGDLICSGGCLLRTACNLSVQPQTSFHNYVLILLHCSERIMNMGNMKSEGNKFMHACTIDHSDQQLAIATG